MYISKWKIKNIINNVKDEVMKKTVKFIDKNLQ